VQVLVGVGDGVQVRVGSGDGVQVRVGVGHGVRCPSSSGQVGEAVGVTVGDGVGDGPGITAPSINGAQSVANKTSLGVTRAMTNLQE
jgi:hypothetical protein